jgi:hypothetical protein
MPNHYSTLAREMARMEADRASWRQALAQTDAIARQMRELLLGNSASAQLTKAMKSLQSPAMTFTQQYQDLLSANSSAMQSIKAWQKAERVQNEQMRRVLDPLDGIRKSLLKELTAASSIRNHIKQLVDQATGIGSVAKMLAQQAKESGNQHKRLPDSATGGSSIQNYLKEFEAINKQWMVPNEVLGIVGSLKEIQEQLGRVALPTIDWGSAGALAKVLGAEGIKEQLALLGIGADGTMHLPAEMPERGILSRRQSDAVALVSLLLAFLSILYAAYQEVSSQQDKAKTEAFQKETTAALQVQAQQIQNLTTLIGQALAQAAQEPEMRFVVRERPAKVRATPEHGAPVEGKLLPNEVVRAIDRKGRWVEVEYYHWLHEEYRTGWVLKHYLERVPTSFSKEDKKVGDG